ncbi:BON domain-containing protein [Aquabacterium sp. A7-Y]|uniref:BON domain-containing protein n=1 Tax=Aquabacterium sp. A7-Y TaxID=1349605 RepID=UPI00223CC073|nr:BON domain-containing protein [Aquabacterium sp. A7-Y]MCW7541135.1 BON domain-containing protein [Aquabacterium sp. A7-Y]
MKSDAELKQDVEAELAWDPAIKSTAIGVAVKDGVVTLSGQLDSYTERSSIEKALRRLEGVQAIALELDVRLEPEAMRSDTELAHAAEMALQWNTVLPADAVRVVVHQGWITLQGEVGWDFQRHSAERTVRALRGVVGISNEISLKHRPTPPDLQHRIQDALTRQAERQAKHITIDMDGNAVTLRGTVHSWHEREAARAAAWAAPGVRTVINRLVIG